MKYLLTVAMLLGVVFLLSQQVSFGADDSDHPVYTPEGLEVVKDHEWARIREMGELEQSGVVPAVPAFPVAQNIGADNIAPYGIAYQRLVNVSTSLELHTALANAQPGDFIYLADGIYNGNFEATVDATAEARIIVYGSRAAILEGTSLEQGYGFHLAADYWTLAGFSVRNYNKGIMTDGANFNVLRSLEVYQIGDEGIHFRSFSSDNLVQQSWVHDVGLNNVEFGEAIYLGSAVSNWERHSNGEPDTSDRNQVIGNLLGPNVAAEAVDIKEGTTGGVVRHNTFISTGENFADSWVDLKGNGYEVSDNMGMYTVGSTFTIAVDEMELVEGWGRDNNIHDNAEYTTEGVERAPFRAPYSGTGSVSIVLVARPLPYTLSEIIARFPASFAHPSNDTVLLNEHLVSGRGAHLILTNTDAQIVRLLSSSIGFVSIAGYRSTITITGTSEHLMEFQSWDPVLNAPDTVIEDGRSYIFMSGGRMDINYASFSDFGFYEGTVSGVAWKGFTGYGETEVSHGDVGNSQFLRSMFGAYTFEAVGMHWYGNTFADNIGYGFDPHDFSNDFLVENNVAYGNGSHGIIFSRGCDRNIIRNNDAFNNQGHGIMLDDGKVLPDSDNPRHLYAVPSNDNIVENNRVWDNEDGIVLEGGSGNIVRNNEISGYHRFGIRLKDEVTTTLITENRIEGVDQYGIFIYSGSHNNYIIANNIVGGHGGIVIRESEANIVKGNTITEVDGSGISLDDEAIDSNVENNVLAGRGMFAINVPETLGMTSKELAKENNMDAWKFPSLLLKYASYAAMLIWLFVVIVPLITKSGRGARNVARVSSRVVNSVRKRTTAL